VTARVHKGGAGFLVQISSSQDVSALKAHWACKEGAPATDALKAQALKKGRARIVYDGEPPKGCSVRADLQYLDGGTKALEIGLN
jgi:hypothetical protein